MMYMILYINLHVQYVYMYMYMYVYVHMYITLYLSTSEVFQFIFEQDKPPGSPCLGGREGGRRKE